MAAALSLVDAHAQTVDGTTAEADQAQSDPTAARIKYLHDRLRITAAEKPLWEPVAKVMRENGKALVPFIDDRIRNEKSGNALDFLHSYEKLGTRQLDGLKRFVAAFEPLYASLSAEQKQTADILFRVGPISLAGGIPQLAETLATPIPYDYAYYPSHSVAPIYPLATLGGASAFRFGDLKFHGPIGAPSPRVTEPPHVALPPPPNTFLGFR